MMKTMQLGTNCDISGVPREYIPGVWEQVVPFVEDAMEHNKEGLHVGDILTALERQEMQLWVAIVAGDILGCAVTAIEVFGSVTQCRYVVVAGKNSVLWWTDYASDVVETWAASRGCTKVIAFCRPGMRKRAAAFGFVHLYEIIGKDLVTRTLQ